MTKIGKSQFILIITLLFAQISYSQSKYIDTGVASYYAKEFHGKKTASGEKYDMNLLTAAHPSLPFNTKVKVTNLKNNKSVVVRINDRGPHTKKRIIDLSKAAASKIGLVQAGIAKVKIEVLDENEPLPEETKEIEKPKTSSKELIPGKNYTTDKKEVSLKGYYIQCASFNEFEKVKEKADILKKQGYNDLYIQPATVKSKLVFRLLIGTYQTKEKAEKEILNLKKKGHSGFVKKIG